MVEWETSQPIWEAHTNNTVMLKIFAFRLVEMYLRQITKADLLVLEPQADGLLKDMLIFCVWNSKVTS